MGRVRAGVWNEIAATARPLSERLDRLRSAAPGDLVYPVTSEPNPTGDALLRDWCRAAARDDWAAFDRRLAALGLTREQVPLLADQSPNADSDADPDGDSESGGRIPWLDFLREAATVDRTAVLTLADSRPESLAELFTPLLLVADQRLAHRVDWATEPLTETVRRDLLQGLQSRLARSAGPCIDTELRRRSVDPWASFMHQQRTEGLVPLWQRYPVLARLLATTSLLWVDRCTELLDRCRHDLPKLGTLTGQPLRRLVGISTGLSDPHHGNASVHRCRFEGEDDREHRVIYKPKDIRAEEVLNQLVVWLNDRGADLGDTGRVLALDGYGWSLSVEPTPAWDQADIQRHFQRSGTLAAVLYALGATDCHVENVVARRDQPVIIDAETILQPTVTSEDEYLSADGSTLPSTPSADTSPEDCVLDSLFLPRWLRIAGRAVDLSALGSADPKVQPMRRELEWIGAGTPGAHLEPRERTGLTRLADLRLPDGTIADPADHRAAIIDGFRRGWRLVADNAGDLLAPNGPVDRLTETPVRVLARMTRSYARILQTSLEPKLLRNGLDHSIHLEHLCRYLLDRADATDSIRLADLEREALELGDIPAFEATGEAWALTDESGRPTLRFRESARARARRRITSMDAAGLEAQLRFVKASLSVAPPNSRARIAAAQADAAEFDGEQAREIAADEDQLTVIRRKALRILGDELANAITPTGDVFGLVAADPTTWGIEPMGPAWYDGTAGVAVALLGVGHALADERYLKLGTQLAIRGANRVAGQARQLVVRHGPGGQDGVGGLLVGWGVAHRLIVDPVNRSTLVRAAEALSAAVDPDELPADADLLAGSLGLLAGLMAADSIGVPPPPDLVRSSLARVTRATDRRLPNGFSHGAAGIVAVLAGAADREWVPPGPLQDQVAQLLERESSDFDPGLGDWPDRREPVSTVNADARPGPGWCNGLPGVALARSVVARTGCARHPGVERMLATDLARCLPRLDRDFRPHDSLCCGTTGRAEVLRHLIGATGPGVPILDADPVNSLRHAHREVIAALALRTVEHRLRLGIPTDCPLPAPGLFQGLAGVTWALAAAGQPATGQPESWPNPLTWVPETHRTPDRHGLLTAGPGVPA